MDSSAKPLVLIPAAGFGRRMGSPQAKELMPLRDSRPLIEAPLRWCADHQWPVVVMTRIEKINLIEYLESQFPRPTILIVPTTKDWPETLLLSQEHWQEWNLVMLPDVEFAPTKVLEQMSFLMTNSTAKIIAATHEVDSISNWGFLIQDRTTTWVGEKPRDHGPLGTSQSPRAWGVFAFHQSIGLQLLTAQAASSSDHQWRKLEIPSHEVQLRSFTDLTRGTC